MSPGTSQEPIKETCPRRLLFAPRVKISSTAVSHKGATQMFWHHSHVGHLYFTVTDDDVVTVEQVLFPVGNRMTTRRADWSESSQLVKEKLELIKIIKQIISSQIQSGSTCWIPVWAIYLRGIKPSVFIKSSTLSCEWGLSKRRVKGFPNRKCGDRGRWHHQDPFWNSFPFCSSLPVFSGYDVCDPSPQQNWIQLQDSGSHDRKSLLKTVL